MSDDEGERKTIKGMKTLKTTSEGGTKLDFEDFKDKISNYFVQSKKNGADIAHLISEREDPIFKEPVELTDDEEKKIINVKRYERQVKTFFQREEQYESNKQTNTILHHMGERV